MVELTKLKRSDVMVATTYASAGLGHLRVVRALESALPPGINPQLFRSLDESVVGIHRLMSIHPWLTRFMEWTQRGLPEYIFSALYRLFLRQGEKRVSANLIGAIKQRKAKVCIIVCTHFGLALQIGSQKKKIEAETKAKIVLAVVVTDDSPQRLWAVPYADLISVPSRKTANALRVFLPKDVQTKIVVNPYPLSSEIVRDLSTRELTERFGQLQGKGKVIFSVPISGAAVGLMYTELLLKNLTRKNENIHCLITTKIAPYTKPFVNRMKHRERISVYSYKDEYDVVESYNELYRNHVIGFEITKPSEQAFKALLCPTNRGGAILLFTNPVGRQEYDNLYFLSRHGLIPTEAEQKKLWSRQVEGLEPAFWRGFRLPSNPKAASEFILWCMNAGIFAKMLACRSTPQAWDEHADEMGISGAERFWEEVEKLV